MIFGVIAALILLVGQSGYYQFKYQQANVSVEITDDTQKADDQNDSQKDAFLTIANDAVSSVVQLNLSHALYQIGQIFHELLITEWIELGEIIPVQEYMETLLQRIISPNAP